MSCPIDNTIYVDPHSLILCAYFLGTVTSFLSRSQWPVVALYALFQFVIFWPGLFRELGEPFRLDFHVYPLLAALMGTIPGVILADILGIPTLINFKVIQHPREVNVHYSDFRRIIIEVPLIVFGALIATAGYPFLINAYSDGCGDLSTGTSLGVGIGLTILGGLMVIITMAWVLFRDYYSTYAFYKRTHVKYIILLATYCLVGVFYDLIQTTILRGVWALIYVTVITILAYFYINWFPFGYKGNWLVNDMYVVRGGAYTSETGYQVTGIVETTSDRPPQKHKADLLSPRDYVGWVLFFFWLTLVVPFTTGYIIFFYVMSDAWLTLVVVTGAGTVLSIIWLILGYCSALPAPILIVKAEDARRIGNELKSIQTVRMEQRL